MLKKILEQKFFILLLIVSASVVGKMHFDNTSVNTIYGVADTKETVISSRHPVIIRKINVVPAQKVYAGDVLVEMESPELSREILRIESELFTLKARSSFNRAMSTHLEDNPDLRGINPLRFQIESLEKQLSLLRDEERALKVTAAADAVVGVVNVRQGERLGAFEPSLTLIKNTPLFVRGYIHEYVNTQTFRNQKVYLRSFSHPADTVTARVLEIGDRIVQFPEQLLRGDKAALWGREIVISLPEGNEFLVGEKLLIQLTNEKLPALRVYPETLLSKVHKHSKAKAL